MDPIKKSTKAFKCFKPPAVTGDDVAYVEERKTKGRHRSTLYAAFKAVLSKTPLMKKPPSEDSSKSKMHRGNKSSHKYDLKEIGRTSSSLDRRSSINSSYSRDTSASSSRSSSMSYTTSNSMSEPEPMKQSASNDNLKKRRKVTIEGRKINKRDQSMDSYKPKIEAFCIVMVCLAALVFCNKGYAIATCTLSCLLLAMGRPRKTTLLQRSNTSSKEVESIDSKEYKKKVIMEGLLERNRARVLLHS